MTESKLARRYALALFHSALRQKILDPVFADLQSLAQIWKENPKFKKFLEAPQILLQEKKTLFQQGFKGRTTDTVFQFLLLLLEKHRLSYFFAICEEFEKFLKEEEGIIPAEIITALPLEKIEKDKLKEKLEKKTGKRIEMLLKVEPEIIGGMIVKLREQIIDQSIRHQLVRLRDDLLSLKVH
jgi:F-type H+-transporting ATPase subunit delta